MQNTPSTALVEHSSSTSMYRYYDANGLLIYVGITKRGPIRNLEHASGKDWWPFVVRQEVEHFDTYEAALLHEKATIMANRPPFNAQHNPGHKALRATYLNYTSGRAVSDKTFNELYRELKRELPLLIAPEGYAKNGITLATLPEHGVLAATLALPGNKLRIRDEEGNRVGRVTELTQFGGVMLLRGTLSDTAHSLHGYQGAAAQLKIVTVRPPHTCHIVAIGLKLADGECG